jgi:hypothetical protein
MILPQKVHRLEAEATLDYEQYAVVAHQPQKPSPSGQRGCRKGPGPENDAQGSHS